eukprot:1160546-Pelagomonas_calceolata.AAC.5
MNTQHTLHAFQESCTCVWSHALKSACSRQILTGSRDLTRGSCGEGQNSELLKCNRHSVTATPQQ